MGNRKAAKAEEGRRSAAFQNAAVRLWALQLSHHKNRWTVPEREFVEALFAWLWPGEEVE